MRRFMILAAIAPFALLAWLNSTKPAAPDAPALVLPAVSSLGRPVPTSSGAANTQSSRAGFSLPQAPPVVIDPQPDPFGPEQHVARTDGQPDIVVSQNCDCKSKASCTCDPLKCRCLNCSDAVKAKPTNPNDLLDQRSLDQGWIAEGDGQTSVFNPRTGQRYFWGTGFEIQQRAAPVWRPMPMQQSFAPMMGGGGRGGC